MEISPILNTRLLPIENNIHKQYPPYKQIGIILVNVISLVIILQFLVLEISKQIWEAILFVHQHIIICVY